MGTGQITFDIIREYAFKLYRRKEHIANGDCFATFYSVPPLKPLFWARQSCHLAPSPCVHCPLSYSVQFRAANLVDVGPTFTNSSFGTTPYTLLNSPEALSFASCRKYSGRFTRSAMTIFAVVGGLSISYALNAPSTSIDDETVVTRCFASVSASAIPR